MSVSDWCLGGDPGACAQLSDQVLQVICDGGGVAACQELGARSGEGDVGPNP